MPEIVVSDLIVNLPCRSDLPKTAAKHYLACYCNGVWVSHFLLLFSPTVMYDIVYIWYIY